MIALDPAERYTAERYLQEWFAFSKVPNTNFRKNKAFPEYFTSFLHQYIFSITDGNAGSRSIAQPASELTTEGDDRLSRIYHDFDKIAFFLGLISSSDADEKQINGETISQRH